MDKIVTMTIEENGDATMLATGGSEVFTEIGETKTQRASHVEPASFVYRVIFHILRWFGDKNQIAEWTRHWPVRWRVNTSPVGGPILHYSHLEDDYGPRGEDGIATWWDRQEAIDAEVEFLNKYFAERTN